MATDNPILVEVWRGEMVESRHRGAIAVVDVHGEVVMNWGDVEHPVYARSAIKPLQAIALIETGAADAYGLGDRELALACASHSGEPDHIHVARHWLARLGLGPEAFECGAHLPYHAGSAEAMLRGGEPVQGIPPSSAGGGCWRNSRRPPCGRCRPVSTAAGFRCWAVGCMPPPWPLPASPSPRGWRRRGGSRSDAPSAVCTARSPKFIPHIISEYRHSCQTHSVIWVSRVC